MRNQPSEIEGNSGRGSNETHDRKNYEGFEGMNYEQRRQPYNPQHTSSSNGTNSDGDNKRHDEL
jgi:hypothetical protein